MLHIFEASKYNYFADEWCKHDQNFYSNLITIMSMCAHSLNDLIIQFIHVEIIDYNLIQFYKNMRFYLS